MLSSRFLTAPISIKAADTKLSMDLVYLQALFFLPRNVLERLLLAQKVMLFNLTCSIRCCKPIWVTSFLASVAWKWATARTWTFGFHINFHSSFAFAHWTMIYSFLFPVEFSTYIFAVVNDLSFHNHVILSCVGVYVESRRNSRYCDFNFP